MSFSYEGYQELDFSSSDRTSIYWHRTVPHLSAPGASCDGCQLTFCVKNSLMELVQHINPGQPELPDWVYNGAMLGVQVRNNDCLIW